MKNVIKFSLLLILFFGCNQKSEIVQPERKTGIPKDAFWIGGVDGGNWYKVEYVHNHRNGAKISVYNDYTGELIISKFFILICPTDNQTLIKDLEKQIDSFDGEKIYLKSQRKDLESCWLQTSR